MIQTATWTGRAVNEHEDYFNEIRNIVPNFDRQPFIINGVENEHLDMIIKEPVNADEGPTPVATVSKTYSLIQHHEVLDAMQIALESMGYPIDEAECNLNITKYGERMWLSMKFPNQHTFDPGDGHPLTLQFHALNSVDRTTQLNFGLGWWRLICANGLMQLVNGKTVKRRHTTSLVAKNLVEYLQESIEVVTAEKEIYRDWNEKPVKVGTGFLENWIDATVKGEWGVRTAARSYHIMRTGMDGKVNVTEANNEQKRLFPHRISVSSETRVPGSKPVENMLDVAHALSYVATHQQTIQTRYEMMHEVPVLVRDLNMRLN